jgi:biotin-dependent carboxylase-like uncharacterized protein
MIRVLSSGIYTTIQDLGRFGFRKYGVPLAGSMDQASAVQANLIVGNEPSFAVIEMLVKGPKLLFENACWICVSGAPMDVKCGQKVVPMNVAFYIEANQELYLGNVSKGRYSYLAIRGGVLAEIVMNSSSYSKGITPANSVKKGSLINCNTGLNELHADLIHYDELDFFNQEVLVKKGPEFDALSIEVQKVLLSGTFVVSNESNRMGYRLETSEEMYAHEIITSPVQPGTVQMTPSGLLIILMRDAQTTGGYARVLQLTAEGINLIAQKRVGEPISFVLNP